MKAIVKTKRNYKNCNGIELEVVECSKSFIACNVPMEGFDDNGKPIGDKFITADFLLKEVQQLWDYRKA